MACNDLGGQIKWAYDTSGWIKVGVYEMKIFNISTGFCVKRALLDGQTFCFIYIDTSIYECFKTFEFLKYKQHESSFSCNAIGTDSYVNMA